MLFGGTANLLLVGYQAIWVTFLIRSVGLSPGRVGTGRFLLVSKFVMGSGALLLPLTSKGFSELFLVGGVAVVAGAVVAGNVVSAGFSQSYCPPAL